MWCPDTKQWDATHWRERMDLDMSLGMSSKLCALLDVPYGSSTMLSLPLLLLCSDVPLVCLDETKWHVIDCYPHYMFTNVVFLWWRRYPLFAFCGIMLHVKKHFIGMNFLFFNYCCIRTIRQTLVYSCADIAKLLQCMPEHTHLVAKDCARLSYTSLEMSRNNVLHVHRPAVVHFLIHVCKLTNEWWHLEVNIPDSVFRNFSGTEKDGLHESCKKKKKVYITFSMWCVFVLVPFSSPGMNSATKHSYIGILCHKSSVELSLTRQGRNIRFTK